MPKRYPGGFHDDVAHNARNRETGGTIERIAKDFGVHTMTLQKSLQGTAVDDGAKLGKTRAEGAGLREARKGIRLLERENEVLRRAAAYLSQADLPGKRAFSLVKELAADTIPATVALGAPPAVSAARGETVSQALPPVLLPVVGRPDHR